MTAPLDPHTEQALRRATRAAWSEMSERPVVQRRGLREQPARRVPGWALSAAAAAAVILVGVVVLGMRNHGGSGSSGGPASGPSSSPVESFTPVHPARVSATSSLPGHDASLTIDGFSNTYWAADTSTDAQPTLTFSFDSPVDIDALLVAPQTASPPGAGGSTFSRPAMVQVTLVGTSGASVTTTLPDAAAPAPIAISGRGITQVVLDVRSLHAQGGQPSVVAIAEVEFFTGHAGATQTVPSPPGPPRFTPTASAHLSGGLTSQAVVVPPQQSIAPIVRVSFRETGLTPGQAVEVGGSMQYSLAYQCTNGSSPPTGGSTVSAGTGAGQRFTADGTGTASGVITLVPNENGMSCPGTEQPIVSSYRYSSVTVQDQTTGAVYTVPGTLSGQT